MWSKSELYYCIFLVVVNMLNIGKEMFKSLLKNTKLTIMVGT